MVLTISNGDCKDKLGHPIDDALLCAILPAYGRKLSEERITVRIL